MINLELTNNECYFLSLVVREINNKYANSIYNKLKEKLTSNNIKNETIFKQEYSCEWINHKNF